MKKIIFTLALVIATVCSANAQGYKWFVGGQVGFWSGKDNGLKNTEYTIMPEIGYSLNSNWTIAAAFGYKYQDHQEYILGTTDKTTVKVKGFRFNPYVRYSFVKVGALTGFVDGSASFGTGDVKGFEAGLKPGIAYSLSDRFCFVAHFGMLGYSDGKAGTSKSKGFGLDLSGYQTTLGFYYSF